MIRNPLRSTALFALLSLAAGACLAETADLSTKFWPRAGCTVGDVRHTGAERWVEARGFGEMNAPDEQVHTVLDDNGPASALRVVLSVDALSNISRIEVRDAQGNWEPVWSGPYRDAAPAGCTTVWFERTLPGTPKLINAVRLGFVPGKPHTMAGAPGLLRVR